MVAPLALVIAVVVVTTATVAVAVSGRSPDSTLRTRARRFRSAMTERFHTLADRFGVFRAWALWLLGWFVLLVALFSGAGFLLLATGPNEGFDLVIVQWLASHRTPAVTTILRVASDISDSITMMVLAVVTGLWWRWRRNTWTALVVLATSFGGAVLFYSAVKRLVARARPPAEIAVASPPGLAFPSGHVTGASAFYVALALLVATLTWRWVVKSVLAGMMILIVVLTAVSRVYLAVHWTTDVLAGALAGTVWATVVVTLLWARIERTRGPTASPGPDRPAEITPGAR